jgi:hypothetical protein
MTAYSLMFQGVFAARFSPAGISAVTMSHVNVSLGFRPQDASNDSGIVVFRPVPLNLYCGGSVTGALMRCVVRTPIGAATCTPACQHICVKPCPHRAGFAGNAARCPACCLVAQLHALLLLLPHAAAAAGLADKLPDTCCGCCSCCCSCSNADVRIACYVLSTLQALTQITVTTMTTAQNQPALRNPKLQRLLG